MSVRERILARIDALGPRMQDAARYVIDHPNVVIVESMRTVASKAGAEPATLVRLAQQLGFTGWPQLKALLADDLGLGTAPYGRRAAGLAGRRNDASLVGELFATQRANLDSTERMCAPALRDAARVLRKASTVHVAGFRASLPAAYTLFYGWRLFRPNVVLVDGAHGALEMQMRRIDRRDAVVAISFAPYSREALAVADAARDAGARLVAVTDSSASPLAKKADATLLFAVASPSFFPSVVASVALAEALLEIDVTEGGDAIVGQIERTERQLFALGAYVLPPARRRGR